MPTQRDTTVRYRTQLFHDACAAVEEHYAHPALMDDLARQLATSRRQLQRAFAEIGGTTFREYLSAVRMRRAMQLLAAADHLSVRQVAAAVGYRQPAQFAKTFRRRHGFSPSQFRSAMRAKRRRVAVAARG